MHVLLPNSRQLQPPNLNNPALKDSYLTAGIKLDRLFRLLRRNKITCNPKTIFRLAFLFQSAAWSTVFSWIETARYKDALMNAPDPDDPIFIIGHWRSGSTMLHQLMNLDPALCTSTLFQVAVPDSFLVSYSWYRPIFKCFVSHGRPMDDVKIGMDEPQEDEYAIYRISDYSPLEGIVFPKSSAYFLSNGGHLLPSWASLAKWKTDVKAFYKKLFFQNRKRIISKNPFHSFRIPDLCEMFPNARFIHIVRSPYSVVPSTIRMWSIVQKQNALNGNIQPPQSAEVVGVLKNLLETVEKERMNLPPGTMVRVRFEDLEIAPVETMRTMYSDLGIEFTHDLERLIDRFMKQNSAFKKNVFTLTDKDKALINRELEFSMRSYGYDQKN